MRFTAKDLVVAAIAVVGGAAIAGCGGDDSNGIGDAADRDVSADAALVDAAPDAARGEAATDADGSDRALDANAVADVAASLDAQDDTSPPSVGTVTFSVDATLQTTTVGTTCAAVAFVAAEPNEVAVGHDMRLTASGVDPGGQSTDVTLTWVAVGSAGSLSGASGTWNAFHCATPGSATVTVTASISDGGDSCPKTGSLTVTLTCDPP